MSYSAYVDEEFAGDVGTNTGIVALRQWAETVGGDALDELLADGWTEAIGTAQAELADGLANNPPGDAAVLASAENLKAIIDRAVQAEAEVIVITDGADGVEIGGQAEDVNPTLQAAIEAQLESVQTAEEAKAIIRGVYP